VQLTRDRVSCSSGELWKDIGGSETYR